MTELQDQLWYFQASVLPVLLLTNANKLEAENLAVPWPEIGWDEGWIGLVLNRWKR